MDSSTIVNTVDAIPPQTSLNVIELGAGAYEVTWSATDDELGTGIRDHTVYVALAVIFSMSDRMAGYS